MKTKAQNIVITLGAEGLLIHAAHPKKTEWITDRLPTLNTSPKDTAGAGDCLLVCSAMALALKWTVWESLYLGSVAAACQVGRIGNIPLTAELLIETQKKMQFNKVMTRALLLAVGLGRGYSRSPATCQSALCQYTAGHC